MPTVGHARGGYRRGLAPKHLLERWPSANHPPNPSSPAGKPIGLRRPARMCGPEPLPRRDGQRSAWLSSGVGLRVVQPGDWRGHQARRPGRCLHRPGAAASAAPLMPRHAHRQPELRGDVDPPEANRSRGAAAAVNRHGHAACACPLRFHRRKRRLPPREPPRPHVRGQLTQAQADCLGLSCCFRPSLMYPSPPPASVSRLPGLRREDGSGGFGPTLPGDGACALTPAHPGEGGPRGSHASSPGRGTAG